MKKVTKLIIVLQMKNSLKRRQRLKQNLYRKDWSQIMFWFLRWNFALTKLPSLFAKWIDWAICKLGLFSICSICFILFLIFFKEITIEPMPTLLLLLKRENIRSTLISVLSILLAVTVSNSNSALIYCRCWAISSQPKQLSRKHVRVGSEPKNNCF